jgi:hypothetical protein
MDEAKVNQTVEQLRALLEHAVMQCGGFGDARVIEISQILDKLILQSQRFKWDSRYEMKIRSTA